MKYTCAVIPVWSSRCRTAFAIELPLWSPWRRWNASSACLSWRLWVALSHAIQWHVIARYPRQLPSDHMSAVKLIWPAASWNKGSIIGHFKNRLHLQRDHASRWETPTAMRWRWPREVLCDAEYPSLASLPAAREADHGIHDIPWHELTENNIIKCAIFKGCSYTPGHPRR